MSACSSVRARRTIAARISSTSRIAVRSLAVSYNALISASRCRCRANWSRRDRATRCCSRSTSSSDSAIPLSTASATTASNASLGAPV